MSAVLITGGAGFIGSHLAEAMIASGNRVVVIDNLSSGRIENLEPVAREPGFEFVEADIVSSGALFEIMGEVDLVVHLAASVGVMNIVDSPVTTIHNNIEGTRAVLEAAVQSKARVMLASTSEVYGKSADVPFREDGNLVLGPSDKARWSYAACKIVDECLAQALWREKRVPITIARLFNTVGPRQVGRYGMVVPRMLAQATSGRNLTVFGTGRQTRCFTCVYDIVEWIRRLGESGDAVGEAVNLGNPEETSIEELARQIIRTTGADVGIDFVPYDEAYGRGFEDMSRRVPDITKVRTLTGYEPKYKLEETLRLTHEWFAGIPKAESLEKDPRSISG